MPIGATPQPSSPVMVSWLVDDQPQTLPWRSENGWAPPKRCVPADDTMTADIAYRFASEGVGLIWTGDFQNARQLLQALARRVAKRRTKFADMPYPERFHQVRLARAQRARTLGMLCLPFGAHHTLRHRRAPDVQQACQQAHGDSSAGYVMPMTELLGLISAYEWRKTGIAILGLDAPIHAHYGVFAPTRAEYLELIRQTALPHVPVKTAFDLGTGTGVLAALLVKKGVAQVIATDTSGRALACASQNIKSLGLTKQITLQDVDLYPTGRADLIVCNPPWLPGRPASPLEHAIYDQDQHMLFGFLNGLAEHLNPKGQGWLILSDLAEHLHLRSREQLLAHIEKAGLVVMAKHDIRPHHPKAKDEQDPLADVRQAETTSLWCLGVAPT
jgi:methylase of polypeptide subunit release factors